MMEDGKRKTRYDKKMYLKVLVKIKNNFLENVFNVCFWGRGLLYFRFFFVFFLSSHWDLLALKAQVKIQYNIILHNIYSKGLSWPETWPPTLVYVYWYKFT